MTRRVAVAAVAVALVGGCRGAVAPPEPVDPIVSATHSARAGGRPLLVLVVQPSRGRADMEARDAFASATAGDDRVVAVVLDLLTSRNRATAAPLHATDRPTLVVRTPVAGVIVSRDDDGIDADLVRQRITEAVNQSLALDAEAAWLSAAGRPMAMAMADFLLAHHNDREAIPLLRQVADDVTAGDAERTRAWVAMGRAHLWVGEPEKARHAAQALMATLGPRSPDAMAGGNLLRGLQDAKAKRYDRAATEFQAAVDVAPPKSPYGAEAAAELEKLAKARGPTP